MSELVIFAAHIMIKELILFTLQYHSSFIYNYFMQYLNLLLHYQAMP